MCVQQTGELTVHPSPSIPSPSTLSPSIPSPYTTGNETSPTKPSSCDILPASFIPKRVQWKRGGEGSGRESLASPTSGICWGGAWCVCVCECREDVMLHTCTKTHTTHTYTHLTHTPHTVHTHVLHTSHTQLTHTQLTHTQLTYRSDSQEE